MPSWFGSILAESMHDGQAQARYVEAAEKFGSMRDRVDGLLNLREEAYLGLLEVPDPGEGMSAGCHSIAGLTLTLRVQCAAVLRHCTIYNIVTDCSHSSADSQEMLIHPSHRTCKCHMRDLA